MGDRVKSKPDKPKYCERIASLLQNRNVSQRELGEAIGSTRDDVNNWVLDRSKPSYEKLIQIADHFHVSAD